MHSHIMPKPLHAAQCQPAGDVTGCRGFHRSRTSTLVSHSSHIYNWLIPITERMQRRWKEHSASSAGLNGTQHSVQYRSRDNMHAPYTSRFVASESLLSLKTSWRRAPNARDAPAMCANTHTRTCTHTHTHTHTHLEFAHCQRQPTERFVSLERRVLTPSCRCNPSATLFLLPFFVLHMVIACRPVAIFFIVTPTEQLRTHDVVV